MKQHFFILFILFNFITPAFAQTVTFNCHYDSYSDETGNQKAEDDFNLTFIMDTDNEKSYITGNNGSTEVKLIASPDGGYSFLELTPARNLVTTAVDKNLKSVHSRNTMLFGELMATQYYGTCEVK